MGIDSARWNESKSGLLTQIGHEKGIPTNKPPNFPHVYLVQCTTQSIFPRPGPGVHNMLLLALYCPYFSYSHSSCHVPIEKFKGGACVWFSFSILFLLAFSTSFLRFKTRPRWPTIASRWLQIDDPPTLLHVLTFPLGTFLGRPLATAGEGPVPPSNVRIIPFISFISCLISFTSCSIPSIFC